MGRRIKIRDKRIGIVVLSEGADNYRECFRRHGDVVGCVVTIDRGVTLIRKVVVMEFFTFVKVFIVSFRRGSRIAVVDATSSDVTRKDIHGEIGVCQG